MRLLGETGVGGCLIYFLDTARYIGTWEGGFCAFAWRYVCGLTVGLDTLKIAKEGPKAIHTEYASRIIILEQVFNLAGLALRQR